VIRQDRRSTTLDYSSWRLAISGLAALTPPPHVCRLAILTTGRRRYLLGSGHCQC
jgi:hypothetical protein